MYNGVGLRTVRGTATNGYVQKSMAYIPKRTPLEYNKELEKALAKPSLASRKPTQVQYFQSLSSVCATFWIVYSAIQRYCDDSNSIWQEILEHQSKRQIELELMKFRDTMEERGYSDDVIETKVAEVRKKLKKQV